MWSRLLNEDLTTDPRLVAVLIWFCLSCSGCTRICKARGRQTRKEKPGSWPYHRGLLNCLSWVLLCFFSPLFRCCHFNMASRKVASGSCSLYIDSWKTKAVFDMQPHSLEASGWKFISKDQKKGGHRERRLFPLCFWITLPFFFLCPLGQFWGCQTLWKRCVLTSPSWKV